MDNIIIGGIAMPRTRSLEIGGYYESKEAIMASGKTVRDVLGWRVELTASWEWVPAGLLAQLVPLVRGGVFVSIDYPDSTGGHSYWHFCRGNRKPKDFQVCGR